jgi:hypothetical protein
MKKTIVLTCLYLFLASCTIILSANIGLAADGIDQAKKLITIERYDAAHRLIESEIIKNPESAKNFFRAGILYINMGWDTQANRSFDFATMLDKGNKYKHKVAKVYQSKAYLVANNGDIKPAKLYLAKAHSLNPSLKQKDIKDFMSFGAEYLQRHQEEKAYLNFKIAQSIDMQQGDTISDLYFEAGKNCKKLCLSYYRRAKEFSSRHDVQIVHLLFSLCKTDGISNQHKKTLKSEIKRYVSKAEFKRMFPPPPPSYKIYTPGIYTIVLKAGETTSQWIMFPARRNNNYYSSSNDNKYIIIFDDGREYKRWKITTLPYKTRVKFKIRAVTNQTITLKVS